MGKVNWRIASSLAAMSLLLAESSTKYNECVAEERYSIGVVSILLD